MLWTELCPHTNSYVEGLTHNVTVFADKADKEVKLYEIIRVGFWLGMISILVRRDTREYPLYEHSRKATWRMQRKVPPARRRAHIRNQTLLDLDLGFCPPELQEINFWCLTAWSIVFCYNSPSRLKHLRNTCVVIKYIHHILLRKNSTSQTIL